MCLFGAFVDITPHFGVKYPQNPIFSSQTDKILKILCYRNYCIDFNQIWHNDRDHQVVIVGGPSRRPTNPRWWTAAILKKNPVKSPYLRHRLIDFDEILHDDAYWALAAEQRLKFLKN